MERRVGNLVATDRWRPVNNLRQTRKKAPPAKTISRNELKNDRWLRAVARLSGRSYEETRVLVLEFLDTDVFHLSKEQCASFLDPLIESWDVDLATLGLEIVLNHRVAVEAVKKLEFVELAPAHLVEEQGLRDFLADTSLSGTATAVELDFLRTLRFTNKRPTALYYYRELQSLRDPLHFRVR